MTSENVALQVLVIILVVTVDVSLPAFNYYSRIDNELKHVSHLLCSFITRMLLNTIRLCVIAPLSRVQKHYKIWLPNSFLGHYLLKQCNETSLNEAFFYLAKIMKFTK